MNSILQKIVISVILEPRNSLKQKNKVYTRYELAYGLKKLIQTTKRLIKELLLISIGVFSAAFGFKGFLLTNHFIDGGATGISLLLSAITHIPLSILIIAINIPFVILGYKIMGKQFAIKTSIAIMALAIVLALVKFPNVTNDNLLVAVFGGFFLGAGIGLAVRGGAVIDGTEVLAIYLSKKLGTTMGDIIIIINIVIFGAAAYYLGIEKALYSMITYISASKTLDFLVEGIEEYIGVTIISIKSESIRSMIINHLGRGVTVYNGQGGFGKSGEIKKIDILYTVLTRLELIKLTTEIEKIDSKAFLVMNSVKDTKGGMLKKRPLKHE
jgi:uncharacterized membrane-anchored protein YitT (DUF2179 family)